MTAPARRRAPFAALLSAYTVSVFGTSMSDLAIPWLVLTTTGSAAKTGLVGFAEIAPYVVAQALAGPLVDRYGLRRCYVWGNTAAALTIGAVPVAYATGTLPLALLVALVAVGGTVRGAADCASSALVPTTATIGRIPLERAAGLNAGANRAALLLGAPAAGILVAWTNPAVAVTVDAATFLAAAVTVAVFLRGIPEPPSPPVTDRPGGPLRRYGRDLAEGIRFIGHDRLLLGICAMVAVTNLLDQGMSAVLQPVWVRHELHSPTALGLLGGALGLGSLIGNVTGAWLAPHVPRRTLYGVGFLLGGAPRFVALAAAATLSPVLAVYLVAGALGGTLNPVIGATSYERIPEHLRPRVLGVIRASAWLGIPFGALAAGFAVDAAGLRLAILVAGGCYLLTTLTPFVFPAWREMRRPDPAPAGDRPTEPARVG